MNKEESKPKETTDVPLEGFAEEGATAKEKAAAAKEVVVSPKGSKVDLTKEEPKKEKPKADSVDVPSRLVRMERMLEWLIVQRVTDDQKLIKQPNIADIFKEIAGKMLTAEKEKKEKKDEVSTDT